ncbi:MAG: hypothetical protein IPM80_19315 [Proteobacteria bacterium]|nr:hypothetical protein [Pseudomonadota bacterium]
MELTLRQKRRALVRWLAVAPSAILVWYVMLALGLAIHSQALRFCPPDALLASYCSASWFPALERAIIVGCAALTGLVIVVVSAFIAPARRTRAAAIVFALGAVVAASMALETRAYGEFAAALGGGLLGVLIASRLAQSVEL